VCTISTDILVWTQFRSSNPSSDSCHRTTTRPPTLPRSHPPQFHFPSVKNNRSPISPNPGLIIPLSSTSLSHPPTQTSTPSSHSSHALLNPSSDANTAHTIILLTPHSRSDSIAAHAVAPVAITGSHIIASAGRASPCASWYGRLL
jgi:hypothetical protein